MTINEINSHTDKENKKTLDMFKKGMDIEHGITI